MGTVPARGVVAWVQEAARPCRSLTSTRPRRHSRKGLIFRVRSVTGVSVLTVSLVLSYGFSSLAVADIGQHRWIMWIPATGFLLLGLIVWRHLIRRPCRQP